MQRRTLVTIVLSSAAVAVTLAFASSGAAGDGDEKKKDETHEANQEANEKKAESWPQDDPRASGVCKSKSFDACGGDLTGKWKLVDMCLTRSPLERLPDDCDGLETDFKLAISGTWEFGEDGTQNLESSLMRRTKIDLPCKCLPKKTRKDLESSDEWTVEGERCIKSETRPETDEEEGFYKTDGSTLYVTDDKDELDETDRPYGGPDDFEYCVGGDTAVLSKSGGRIPGGHQPDRRLFLERVD